MVRLSPQFAFSPGKAIVRGAEFLENHWLRSKPQPRQPLVTQLHGTVFSRLKHDAHMRAREAQQRCSKWETTMLSLCLLAFTVTIATLVTPVAVPIMWNKIEGSAAAKEPRRAGL